MMISASAWNSLQITSMVGPVAVQPSVYSPSFGSQEFQVGSNLAGFVPTGESQLDFTSKTGASKFATHSLLRALTAFSVTASATSSAHAKEIDQAQAALEAHPLSYLGESAGLTLHSHAMFAVLTGFIWFFLFAREPASGEMPPLLRVKSTDIYGPQGLIRPQDLPLALLSSLPISAAANYGLSMFPDHFGEEIFFEPWFLLLNVSVWFGFPSAFLRLARVMNDHLDSRTQARK